MVEESLNNLIVYENEKLFRELEDLKFVLRKVTQKKSLYLKQIDEFNSRYDLELRTLLGQILYARRANQKKKFILQKRYYSSLVEEYKSKKILFQSLKEMKSTLLVKLQTATISEYETLFRELTSVESSLEESKSILNNIKSEIQKLDIQELKSEYTKIDAEYKEFNQEEQDTDDELYVLEEQDEIELKKLYKKASKICHPDLVDITKIEDAQDIFKELNQAYRNRDLKMVREIFNFLDSGDIFKRDTEVSKELDLLRAEIKKLEELKERVIQDIYSIKNEDEFSFIFDIEDLDLYFVELKGILEVELASLKNTKIEPIEQKSEEWISKLYRWADRYKIADDILPRDETELKELTTLDLSALSLTHISSEITKLDMLEYLNLSNNIIAKLPDDFSKLTSLRFLNLSRNQLDEVPNSFRELKKLECINLSYNRFSEIPLVIGDFRVLKKLDFSHNNISDCIKELGNLENLQELYFNKNLFKRLSKEIENFSKLTTLEFGGNYIDSIPHELYNIKGLTTLSLWGNRLREIPKNIHKLQRLERLNLGSNELTSLPIEIIDLANISELELFMNPKLLLNKHQLNWQDKINAELI